MRLLAIAFTAIIAITIGTTLVYYNLFEKQVRNDLRVSVELLDESGVFEQVNSESGQISKKQLKATFQKIEKEKLRITWVDQDGTVLFDNDTDALELDNHLMRPEIQDAIATGSGESVRQSDTLNMNTYYYALRLSNDTVIRVSMEAHNMTSIFMASFPFILVFVIVILMICVYLARMMTSQLLTPIYKMAEHIDDPLVVPEYEELIPFANKIRNQHEDILQAAKSRQDFTANVSHELKTPLTAISGYAELIENKMVEPDQEIYFASQIRKNAQRLVRLINDIIRLSEVDSQSMDRVFTNVDIYELVKECCGELRVMASNANIRLSYTGYSCIVNGDMELLRELILNLIQNAVRYNNPGGSVDVCVFNKQKHVVLSVTDDGIGIPKETQEQIFERFYRVDKSRSRKTGGTGLGLAIVKHIVEMHDAQIRVESEVGKGTSMIVEF